MSFPDHIPQQSLSFLDPYILINNLDALYLLSLKETDGLSEKSIIRNVYQAEELQGLEAYSDLIEFNRNTYLKLRQELFRNIDEQSRLLTRGLIHSRNEYYCRASMFLSKINHNKISQPIALAAYYRITDINIFKQSQCNYITPTLHSNPSKWPWGLEDYYKSLQQLEPLSLFYEPDYVRANVEQNFQRILNDPNQEKSFILKVYTEYMTKIGTFSSFLKLCQQSHLANEQSLKECVQKIKAPIQKHKNLHYMRSLCDIGGFSINQVGFFNKLAYNQVSLTCSSSYLFLYISSPIGMMLKIGTGMNNTIQGKVYLQVSVKKQEEVQWVYLHNKLYLRYGSKDMSTLEILCPDTFQVLSQVTLHCPDIFHHPQMQNINKNYPLLTDGERLYVVGRKLNIQKSAHEHVVVLTEEDKKKLLHEQLIKREEKSKRVSRPNREAAKDTKETKEEKEKEHQDHTIKIMDFILYEFDLNKTTGSIYNEEESDVKLLQELYESFQGYFDRAECSRALNLNKNDVQNAAQWLVEEGERERNKTTVVVSRQTLLCQSEIITDISAKQIKSSLDIGCKEQSILTPGIVSNIIWTMNKEYITAYTEQGTKIFSTDPAQVKDLHVQEEFNLLDNYQKQQQKGSILQLKGSYVKTVDKYLQVYYQQPNYLVSYDIFNQRYYIVHMMWNSVQNVLPALVTISSDYQNTNKLQSFELTQFDSIGEQFQYEILYELMDRQNYRYTQQWKLNDYRIAIEVVIRELKVLQANFNEEEKKKMNTERIKFIQRLNKIIQNTQQLKYPESKKIYAYSVEGTLEDLELLWSLFKTASKKLQQIYLQFLLLWVKHSQMSIIYQSTTICMEISDYIYQNIQDPLVEQILLYGWPLFMFTSTQQLKFISLGNLELLDKIVQFNDELFPFKDSAIHIRQKIEITAQTDVNQLIQKIHPKCRQDLFIEPLSRLMIPQILKSKGIFKKVFPNKFILQEQPINELSQQFWQLLREWANQAKYWAFIHKIFIMGWNQLKNAETQQQEWELRYEFTKNILSIYEVGLQNNILLTQSEFLSHIFLQLFLSSTIASPIDVNILQQLQKCFILMRDKLNLDNGSNLLSHIPAQQQVGVDQVGAKIFETSHPYERQKVQAFEDSNSHSQVNSTYFPGALALLIEFDPRCSSDQAHDFLSINSWYSPHTGSLGSTTTLKDPIGMSYKVSGKLNIKRPILMLGNVIQADFTPSGQARNEHSLNRWGFKITIRPIYGIKTNEESFKQEQCQSILTKFQNVQNIENWINSIKILTMIIIENINVLMGFNELRTQQEIDCQSVLKWNLLKNGSVNYDLDKNLVKMLGQIAINQQSYNDALYLHTINDQQLFGFKTKEQSRYWNLKRELFRVNYKFRYQGEQSNQEVNLWELVIHQNKKISKHIQEIKNSSGEFFKFAKDILPKFSDSYQYRQEKFRAAFKNHGQELWTQIEMMLILVVLYHSGLLQSEVPDFKQYLEHHLEMLQDARNQLINFMIKEVQVEVEYQQNFEAILLMATEEQNNQQQLQSIEPQPQLQQVTEKENTNLVSIKKRGNQIKVSTTKKVIPKQVVQPQQKSQSQQQQQQQQEQQSEKNQEDLWKILASRLEGNSEMIYAICQLKQIKQVNDDPNASLRNIFNHIISLIKTPEKELLSPYKRIGDQIMNKILLLFLVNNVPLVGQIIRDHKSNNQSVDSESLKSKLRPLGLERSISHQIDDKHIDSNKLLKFRQWLESYQKWKQLHNVAENEENAESANIPAVKSVIYFLKQDIDSLKMSAPINNSSLLNVMNLHNRRCVRRIAALKLLNEFCQQIPNNCILTSFVSGGLLCQGDVLNTKIELGSSEAKEVLLHEMVKRLNYLMGQVNQMGEYANFLNQAMAQNQNQQQLDITVLESLKQMCTTLTEINQLFQVENNILWKSRQNDYNPHFNPIFKQFLQNVIRTGLLSQAFINLDQQYQSVATLSYHILCNVKTTLLIITENLLPDEVLDSLSLTLSNELGIQEDQIFGRQLMKLHDLVGVKRVNFLLTHIYDVLLYNMYQVPKYDLLRILFIILQHSNTPSTIRLSCRIIKQFKDINYKEINIQVPYQWNVYNMESKSFESKTLSNKHNLNCKDTLVDRIGRSLSTDSDPEYLPHMLQTELINIQQRNVKLQDSEKRYKVIIHLCQEEEISILLKILYWWEELYPNIKNKLPSTLQEYQEAKDKEKKREEQKSQQQEVIAQQTEFQSQRAQQQQQYKILERVFLTYPEMGQDDQKLNLGWAYNYSNIFGDLKQQQSDNKKQSTGRVKKQIKKYWRPLNFQELERLYEELFKQNEEPKGDIDGFLKQRNFITRIYNHLKEIKNYGSLLTVYGCITLSESFTFTKAEQLIEIIQAALNNKLPPIPLDGLSEEFKSKADPNKYILCGPIKEIAAPAKGKQAPQKSVSQIPPQATTGKSQLIACICDQITFQTFEFRMDYITLLPYGNTSVNFYKEVNRSSSFTQQCITGNVLTQINYELIQLLQDQIDINGLFDSNPQYQLGISAILSGWTNQLAPGIPVIIKKHKQSKLKHYLISQPLGQKTVQLIGDNDISLNIQQLSIDDIEIDIHNHKIAFTQTQMVSLLKLINQSQLNQILLRNILIIASKIDWSEFHDIPAIINIMPTILQLTKYCQSDATEQQFCQSWQRVIDSKLPLQYVFPIELSTKDTLQYIDMPLIKQESYKIQQFEESVEQCVFIGSTYLSSLPEASTITNELKLVQYWEKHILPKVYDYVKGSLRQYEIEDFFEQIRQPLRKGDQSKALEIAYIVCDQRMPNGVVIPDTNHDWSTLTIEEVQAGQFVLCRLTDKNSDQLYSKDYIHYRRQGLTFICGQIIGVDQRSSSILILHEDVNQAQQFASWFPVNALKQVQIYIIPPAQAYQQSTIEEQFKMNLTINISHKARTLNLILSQHFSKEINSLSTSYLELAVQEQLKGSCIDGWLQEQGYVVNLNRRDSNSDNNIIRKIQLKMQQDTSQLNGVRAKLADFIELGQSKQLMQWIESSFQKMSEFVLSTKQSLDLQKTHKKPSPLNPENDDVAGLAIVFKDEAKLCMCSGLKFYNDPAGINDFYTITNGKEVRNRLTPIILNKKQVYCEYYFNAEAIPIFQQQNCVSELPCIVYKIPSLWNVCCFITDYMATIFMQKYQWDELAQLNQLLQKIFNQFKGPHLLLQTLIKLITRTTRKLRIGSKNLNLDNEFLNARLQEMQKLYDQQRKEPNVLYSAYLQDLCELLAVGLAPLLLQNKQLPTMPEWLQSYIQLVIIVDFIKNQDPLTDEIIETLKQSIQIKQMDYILFVQNLPQDQEFLKEVLQQSKARILNPAIDIQIKENAAIIILDGYSALDLEEINEEQRRKEAEEQFNEEQTEPLKFWQCSVCTCAENLWDSTQCGVCESPAPSVKIPFGETQLDEIPPVIVDINQEDKLAEQKEQQRFDELINNLKNRVQKYYDNKRLENEDKIKSILAQNEAIQQQIALINKKIEQDQLKQRNNKKKGNINKEVNQNLLNNLQEQINQNNKQINQLKLLKFENNLEIIKGDNILQHQHGSIFLKDILKKRFALGTPSQYKYLSHQFVRHMSNAYNDAPQNIKTQSLDQFLTQLDENIEQDPYQVWKQLESMGYDLWLNQIGIYKQGQSSQLTKILPMSTMKQLIKFIEFDICKETKAVISYNPQNIRFPQFANLFECQEEPPINYGEYSTSLIQYNELSNSPQWQVRLSWALIKQFNKCLEQAGQFINMDIPIGSTFIFQENQLLLSMANYITVLRRFCMAPIKIEIVQRVLNKSSISRDSAPKVSVERIKLARENKELKKGDIIQAKNKDDFLFSIATEQLKNVAPTQLRPTKPQGTDPFLAFELNFKGEDVQGESGPYRQFFADISRELQTQGDGFRNMNLLVPSTNNQAKMGNARDKFVLNPSARSTYQLQLFEFFGLLMAISIRTATHFTLDLPIMFWKSVVGEEIVFEDIEQVDATMCNLINFMQECSNEMFEENIFENWITLRSDRSVQELKENGNKLAVQFEDRFEYISKLIEVKFTESESACLAIKQGLSMIIPTPLLNWISAEDLELWVCGRPTVDIDLLKRHTRYSGELNENSERIKYFWEALHELTEQEKLKLIKFCWGQERLPANDEEFERNQIRLMIKPATYATKTPNKALPKADTCFFNLELPNYSSKQILKDKLLIAINFDCDSMNAEQRINLDPNARNRRQREEEEDSINDNEMDEQEQEEEE